MSILAVLGILAAIVAIGVPLLMLGWVGRLLIFGDAAVLAGAATGIGNAASR